MNSDNSKSFTIINNFKQWKVSYGEDVYRRIGCKWYVEMPSGDLKQVNPVMRIIIENLWIKKAQTW